MFANYFFFLWAASWSGGIPVHRLLHSLPIQLRQMLKPLTRPNSLPLSLPKDRTYLICALTQCPSLWYIWASSHFLLLWDPHCVSVQRQLWLIFPIRLKMGEELFIKHHFCVAWILLCCKSPNYCTVFDYWFCYLKFKPLLFSEGLTEFDKKWLLSYGFFFFLATNPQNLIKYWKVILQEGSRTWKWEEESSLVGCIGFR